MGGWSRISEPKIRYVATRADQVAKLQLYASRTSAARWFPPVTYATVIGLSWLSAGLFYVRQGDKNYVYVASGLLALFLTVSLPWLYRRYQDNFFASLLSDDNLRGLIGPVELTIDNEWIEERRGGSALRLRWADVGAVEDGKEYIIIRIAPLVTIMVPHRAFENDRVRAEFTASIRAMLSARQS